jgi:hypothetical protein
MHPKRCSTWSGAYCTSTGYVRTVPDWNSSIRTIPVPVQWHLFSSAPIGCTWFAARPFPGALPVLAILP